MKICVPTSGKGGLDDVVSEHFGRAPTFTVVDIESGHVDVIKNNGEHMGGTGKPSEQVSVAGAEVVVCSGLGQRARSMLESRGIDIFVGANGNVSQAVELWRSGKLQKASDQNACKDHRH